MGSRWIEFIADVGATIQQASSLLPREEYMLEDGVMRVLPKTKCQGFRLPATIRKFSDHFSPVIVIDGRGIDRVQEGDQGMRWIQTIRLDDGRKPRVSHRDGNGTSQYLGEVNQTLWAIHVTNIGDKERQWGFLAYPLAPIFSERFHAWYIDYARWLRTGAMLRGDPDRMVIKREQDLDKAHLWIMSVVHELRQQFA